MGRLAKSHPLLDAILKRYEISNDTELAEKLRVTRQSLSMVRNGNTAVSGELRCAIMRRFGASLRWLDDLDPPEKKEK